MIPKDTIFAFTEGEYSDYSIVALYKAIKDIPVGEIYDTIKENNPTEVYSSFMGAELEGEEYKPNPTDKQIREVLEGGYVEVLDFPHHELHFHYSGWSYK